MLFIFNKSHLDSPQTLEEKLFAVRTTLRSHEMFKESHVHVLNVQEAGNSIQSEVASEALERLVVEIMRVIESKMSIMIFQFARSLFHLLHTHYLLLSKVVAHKMQKPALHDRSFGRSSLFQSRTPPIQTGDSVQQKITAINVSIEELLQEADRKIARYQVEMAENYQSILDELDPKLLILAREIPTNVSFEANESSWFQTMLDNLQSKHLSPFEEELYKSLIDRFTKEYSRVRNSLISDPGLNGMRIRNLQIG